MNFVLMKKLWLFTSIVLGGLFFNQLLATQTINCGGTDYTLKNDNSVAVGNLQNANLLRCENDVLFAEMLNGDFKLFNGTTWIDIKQLITIGANSYYLKADGSVWNAVSKAPMPAFSVPFSADYLVSNDKKLVAISNGSYQKFNGNSWSGFTPTFVPSSPTEQLTMTHEGLWFFIQNRAAYDIKGDLHRRDGLTLNASNQPVMETIPLRGKYDKFLWRVNKISGSTFELINKVGSKKLTLNGSSNLTVTLANQAVYGTIAYNIKQGTKSLTYNDRSPEMTNSSSSIEQVWLFHFNQMVSTASKTYMLPRNTGTDQRLRKDFYDRILKGPHNTSFIATKTTSDWALVSTYFIQTNVMNAIKGDVNNTINRIVGYVCYVINKNDPDNMNPALGNSTSVPNIGLDANRGGANNADVPIQGGLNQYLGSNFVVTSEEFMCRVGPMHRPDKPGYREFDHQVHEFFHILEGRLWRGTSYNLDGKAINTGVKIDAETVANTGELYFNSMGGINTYPGDRVKWDATEEGKGKILETMHDFFDPGNIWFPPAKLRDEFEGNLSSVATNGKTHAIVSSSNYLAWDQLILYSPNERFALKIEQDGRIIRNDNVSNGHVWDAYNDAKSNPSSKWPTSPDGSGGEKYKVKFENGNLSIHLVSNNSQVWESGTAGNPNAKLIIDNSGKIMVVDSDNQELFPNSPVQEMICKNSRTGSKITLLPKDGSTFKIQVDWDERSGFAPPNSLTLTNGNCLSCPNLGGSFPRQAVYEFEAIDANQPIRIQWGPFATNYCGTDEITVNNTGTPAPAPAQVMNCANSRTGAKISLLPRDGTNIKLQVEWNEGSTFSPPNSIDLTNADCVSCPTLGGPNPKQGIYEIAPRAAGDVIINWGRYTKSYCGSEKIVTSN
jgi:hypothetical protein